MPEINSAAAFLIATSWQALKRSDLGDRPTMMTNSTIIILFAGFYIEANLNHIIARMDKVGEVSEFGEGARPGLTTKLAWFYKSHISEQDESDKRRIYDALWRDYPDIKEIIDFRNKVSHGEFDRDIVNLDDAKRLRLAAKDLAKQLLAAAEAAGCSIERKTTYKMAIGSFDPSSEGSSS